MALTLSLLLVPFLLIVTYEFFTTDHWQLRRHCGITVISMLITILAFWL